MPDISSSEAEKKSNRFSLALIDDKDRLIVEEFKRICRLQKKRYTKVVISLIEEYIADYKATR